MSDLPDTLYCPFCGAHPLEQGEGETKWNAEAVIELVAQLKSEGIAEQVAEYLTS